MYSHAMKTEKNKLKMGSWRLPAWILDKLRETSGPQGKLITEALVKAYGWRAPNSPHGE